MRGENVVRVVFAAIFLAIAADIANSRIIDVGPATVREVFHCPSRDGYETGFTSNGDVVTMSSHEPEKWIVVVVRDGAAESINCDPATWSRLRAGQSVRVHRRVGLMFTYGTLISD